MRLSEWEGAVAADARVAAAEWRSGRRADQDGLKREGVARRKLKGTGPEDSRESNPRA